SGPKIAQESFFTVSVLAQRFARKINMHSAGERECHHQRMRHQEIRLDMLMYARFEVAVSRKHRGSNQIEFMDCLLDFRMERSGIADAGRATVADQIKPELIEIFFKSCVFPIVG